MPGHTFRQVFAIAASLQDTARSLNLVEFNRSDTVSVTAIAAYDALITQPELINTTRKLFIDGYFSLAVEEGFKQVNNTVKNKAKQSIDGASLMRTVLSPKSPLLKLNRLKTQSQRDQQQGYMDIFAGCMTGIRNPRAHQHQHLDDADVALELLVLANHLLKMINHATRAKKRAQITE